MRKVSQGKLAENFQWIIPIKGFIDATLQGNCALNKRPGTQFTAQASS